MRTLLVSALGLALASAAFADTYVDFNAPGDFATYFSSAQSGGIIASGSGGLSDSGSLDITGLPSAPQMITFNQGFSPTMSSWSASIYFYGDAQNFWQFGVTTKAAPDLDDFGYPGSEGESLPVIWIQTGNDSGGALGIGNYSPGPFHPEEWNSTLVPSGLPTSNAWYRYTISGTYLGDDQYDIHALLYEANADGTLGAQLAEFSFEVYNSGLAASETLYFFISPGQGVTLDNFHTDLEAIPEPATLPVLLAGAAVLAWHRRRSRR